MPTSKAEWRGALVPIFLAAQILLIRAAAGVEHPPAVPPLARFPVEFDRWKVLREDPIAADMARELGADRLWSQTYMQTPTGSLANLLVAWFQTQRGGVRQPHSPKVCLPAPAGRLRFRTRSRWTPRPAPSPSTVMLSPTVGNAPWFFTGIRRRGARSRASGRQKSGWWRTPCATGARTRHWFAWLRGRVRAGTRPQPPPRWGSRAICTRCCASACLRRHVDGTNVAY